MGIFGDTPIAYFEKQKNIDPTCNLVASTTYWAKIVGSNWGQAMTPSYATSSVSAATPAETPGCERDG